jgi:hypothetical protein
LLGFRIVEGPDRGQDGGRDVIVEEIRKGIIGESKIRWLVSCKHKAHSNSSVGTKDEIDIPGRVAANQCEGFIGFYSTLPSSGLTRQLEGLKGRMEYQLFDHEKIESYLLSPSCLKVAERYFPESISKLSKSRPKPERHFWKYPILKCVNCGKKLLEPDKSGIVVIWKTLNAREPKEIVDLYCCCKGSCDRVLQSEFRLKHKNAIDGWDDIEDICIPTIYFKWLSTMLNRMQNDIKYSDLAFRNMMLLLQSIFPYISRELTAEEKKRIQTLAGVPCYLGGLGFEE